MQKTSRYTRGTSLKKTLTETYADQIELGLQAEMSDNLYKSLTGLPVAHLFELRTLFENRLRNTVKAQKRERHK